MAATKAAASREHRGPVISVRAFITSEEGTILVLKRSKSNYGSGAWCLPGGKVDYGDSPEQAIVREIKEETGLRFKNYHFLAYQNSPPLKKGFMHCLNMYFAGTADGDVKINSESAEYAWVTPQKARAMKLVFGAADVLPLYMETEKGAERELELLNEAALAGIPVTRKRLAQILPQPGFFKKLRADIDIYDQVRRRVVAGLELIQSRHMRHGESIVLSIGSRTKTAPSILEKMVRKGRDGVPRHYTTFDDMAGTRMNVSFLEDLHTVVEDIRTSGEFAIREIDDKVKKPLASGYRGVHLTIEVPLPKIDFVPRCELQIRTAYQDSWASKAHVLTYKRNDIPKRYLGELLRLSKALHEADKTSDALRKKIEAADVKKKKV